MNRFNRLALVLASLCLALGTLSAHADEEDELRIRSARAQEVSDAPPPPSVESPAQDEPADAVERSLRLALDRAVELEIALSSGGNRLAREELAGLRQELQSALIALGRLRQDQDTRSWLEQQSWVREGHQPAVQEPVRPPTAARALRDDEVDQLARGIAAEPFNEGKLKALRQGIAGRTITSAQAGRLLDRFSFSRDRVDVLVDLHPRLAEGEDFDGLLSALKFESDRQVVRDRLGLDG